MLSTRPFAAVSAYSWPTGPLAKLGSLAVTMPSAAVTLGNSVLSFVPLMLSSGGLKEECLPPATRATLLRTEYVSLTVLASFTLASASLRACANSGLSA